MIKWLGGEMMKKDAYIPMIRITENQKLLLEKVAYNKGFTITDYIRYLVQKDLERYEDYTKI